jgi:GNAT superfamily N-acetyltransferase
MDDVSIRDLGGLADENLAGAWTHLARRHGRSTGSFGTIDVAVTGLPIAFFNGAYLRARSDDPAADVAGAVSFLGEQLVPFLVWVREGVDDDAVAAGRELGLREAGGPPAMGISPIPAAPDPPDELRIDVADDEAGIQAHLDVVEAGFELPRHVGARLVSSVLLGDAATAILVGRVRGEPVSCSLLCVTGTTAGVYNVATPPAHRRRGYGAAMTWAAIDEGRRRGCTSAVLQASVAGYPVYRAMGFVDLGRYVQLEGP